MKHMIKAMIIDDEKLIREGLVTYIDWAALGVEVCAVCGDCAGAVRAAALHRPQIILADEPVASLDPVTAKQVMDDFQRINRDMRITILINIHHVDLALQYATRVIGIRAGRVVYDGPAGEVDGAVLDAIYQDRKEATA